MPHGHQRIHRSHLHKVKRLTNNNHRYGEQMDLSNLPRSIIDENFLHKSSKYIKFFDHPLPELLADHSTDPMQNTTRQYSETSNIPTEGRFANHQMIIRRNGETTILRPKQDLVLANGFTPVIRPSSLLPSYPSIMSHSQVAPSLSIINKMSITKPEQASIIKTKRKNHYRTKRCNEDHKPISEYNFSNDFNHKNSSQSNFIHLVQQALNNIVEEKQIDNNYLSQQPVPLMSILPQFHDPPPNRYKPSFIPPVDDLNFNRNTIQSTYFNERQTLSPLMSMPELKRGLMSNNHFEESSYKFPEEKYFNFEQNYQLHFDFPRQERHEHVCLRPSTFHDRNYTQMRGYFFD